MVLGQDSRLGPKAKQTLTNQKAEVFISIASFWEMAIKVSINKLQLQEPLQKIIQASITIGGLNVLPIQVEHIYGLETLPFHHRDPFDRLLISQAKYEGMSILSGDRAFDRYGVERVW